MIDETDFHGIRRLLQQVTSVTHIQAVYFFFFLLSLNESVPLLYTTFFPAHKNGKDKSLIESFKY